MSERFIPEHRRTQFKAKNTFKPDELRRRREEQQVEIRKAKREENLAKRRGITGPDGSQQSAPGASLGAAVDSDDEGGTIESQVCGVVLSKAIRFKSILNTQTLETIHLLVNIMSNCDFCYSSLRSSLSSGLELP